MKNNTLLKKLFANFDTVSKRLGGNPKSHFNYFKGGYKAAQQDSKSNEADIIDAWNSAYGGDSFLDGKDYLKYLQSLRKK